MTFRQSLQREARRPFPPRPTPPPPRPCCYEYPHCSSVHGGFCEQMFSLLLRTYLRVAFLGHVRTRCFTPRGAARRFAWVSPFPIPVLPPEGPAPTPPPRGSSFLTPRGAGPWVLVSPQTSVLLSFFQDISAGCRTFGCYFTLPVLRCRSTFSWSP